MNFAASCTARPIGSRFIASRFYASGHPEPTPANNSVCEKNWESVDMTSHGYISVPTAWGIVFRICVLVHHGSKQVIDPFHLPSPLSVPWQLPRTSHNATGQMVQLPQTTYPATLPAISQYLVAKRMTSAYKTTCALVLTVAWEEEAVQTSYGRMDDALVLRIVLWYHEGTEFVFIFVEKAMIGRATGLGMVQQLIASTTLPSRGRGTS